MTAHDPLGTGAPNAAPTAERPQWIVWFAALALVLLTARLGWWQLDRAAQKEALQAQLTAQTQASPLVGARALPVGEAALQAQHYRPVELVGRWRAADTLYLDNRPMDGRPGFIVVTPLLLDDGTAMLVQRGWTPRDATRRTQVQTIDTPEDSPVHVSARLAPWPSRLYDLGAEVPGAIRQNVDRVELQAGWGLPLKAATLQQLEPARRESAAGAVLDDGLLRRWPLPAADVHKHYGYAFQWFGMSLLTVGLTVWFAWWKPRRLRRIGSLPRTVDRDR